MNKTLFEKRDAPMSDLETVMEEIERLFLAFSKIRWFSGDVDTLMGKYRDLIQHYGEQCAQHSKTDTQEWWEIEVERNDEET